MDSGQIEVRVPRRLYTKDELERIRTARDNAFKAYHKPEGKPMHKNSICVICESKGATTKLKTCNDKECKQKAERLRLVE